MPRGFSVADAEADADGDVGLVFQRADVGGDGVGLRFLCAGNAAQRDEVEEAASVGEDVLAAVGGGGRRDQHDGGDAARFQVGVVVGERFYRAIDEDDGIATSGGDVSHGAGKAGALEAVEVTHQDERRVVVGGAEFAHDGEGLREGYATRQRAFVCLLDGFAVSGGVGEGNAEFQRVRTACDQRVQHGGGLCRIGVARADVGNERLAPLRLERGEAFGKPFALFGGLRFVALRLGREESFEESDHVCLTG